MLPFHEKQFRMTYPLPFYMEENQLLDYSYLEELYPLTMKAYQVKVKEAVNEIDYPGSVIYDEYPDALTLYGIAKRIADQISLDEALTRKINEEVNCEKSEKTKEEGPCKLIELIQVLFYMEIHKRRVAQGNGRSFSFYRPLSQNEVEKITKTIYNKE